MRDLRFRAFDKLTKKMIATGFHVFGEVTMFHLIDQFIYENPGEEKYGSGLEMELARKEDIEVMQFTGHTLRDNDIYEYDIIRQEEEGDNGDEVTYYIVIWLKEWSMFAGLRVNDEYQDYLSGGVQKLDTTMFWTFPFDTDETCCDACNHFKGSWTLEEFIVQLNLKMEKSNRKHTIQYYDRLLKNVLLLLEKITPYREKLLKGYASKKYRLKPQKLPPDQLLPFLSEDWQKRFNTTNK